jgi:hypothetical protein
MSVARHTVSRLAVTGVAASLLVGGAATQASAAAAYPHVTLAKAKTALPTSKSLPGGVKLVGKVRSAGRTYGEPCTTKPKKVPLAGGSVVIADYGNSASPVSPKYQQYEVSVVVFATAAQAKAGLAKLNAAEKVCPKTGTVTESGIPVQVTRTVSVKATSKAWTGHRTIDHVVASSGSTSVALRGYETYLTRGNMIVVIDQIGPGTAATGKAQETRRKTVTNLVIKRLSALK